MKRVGTDPKMDEDSIVHLLNITPAVDNIGLIQAGAAQALLDMYDRGITRQEFCESASSVLALYSQCAKLWLLRNIEIAHARAPLTEDAFKQAHDGIIEIMQKQVEEVVMQVQRMQQCPTSEDAIH